METKTMKMIDRFFNALDIYREESYIEDMSGGTDYFVYCQMCEQEHQNETMPWLYGKTAQPNERGWRLISFFLEVRFKWNLAWYVLSGKELEYWDPDPMGSKMGTNN